MQQINSFQPKNKTIPQAFSGDSCHDGVTESSQPRVAVADSHDDYGHRNWEIQAPHGDHFRESPSRSPPPSLLVEEMTPQPYVSSNRLNGVLLSDAQRIFSSFGLVPPTNITHTRIIPPAPEVLKKCDEANDLVEQLMLRVMLSKDFRTRPWISEYTHPRAFNGDEFSIVPSYHPVRSFGSSFCPVCREFVDVEAPNAVPFEADEGVNAFYYFLLHRSCIPPELKEKYDHKCKEPNDEKFSSWCLGKCLVCGLSYDDANPVPVVLMIPPYFGVEPPFSWQHRSHDPSLVIPPIRRLTNVQACGQTAVGSLNFPGSTPAFTILSQMLPNPTGVDYVNVRQILAQYNVTLIGPTGSSGNLSTAVSTVERVISWSVLAWIDKTPTPLPPTVGFFNGSGAFSKICFCTLSCLEHDLDTSLSAQRAWDLDATWNVVHDIVDPGTWDAASDDPFSTVLEAVPLYFHVMLFTGQSPTSRNRLAIGVELTLNGTVSTPVKYLEDPSMRIAHFNQLEQPLWVTEVNPGLPPIQAGPRRCNTLRANREMHAYNGNSKPVCNSNYAYDPVLMEMVDMRYIDSYVEDRLKVCLPQLSPHACAAARIWFELDNEWTGPKTLPSQPADTTPEVMRSRSALKDKSRNGTPTERTEAKLKLKEQHEAVMERLLKKLSTYESAIEYIFTTEHRIDNDFILDLLSKLSARLGFYSDCAYVFESEARRLPVHKKILGLASYSTGLAKLMPSTTFMSWLSTRHTTYTDEIASHYGYGEPSELEIDPNPMVSLEEAEIPAPAVRKPYIYPSKDATDNGFGKAQQLGRNKSMYTEQGNDGYSVYLQSMNNKLAHALNGNTEIQVPEMAVTQHAPPTVVVHLARSYPSEFPNNMAEIRASPKLVDIMAEKKPAKGLATCDAVSEVERISGLRNVQGVGMSDVPREMPMRGGILNVGNTLTVRNDLNHPEALLYPRQLRGAGVVNSPHRIQIYGVGTTRRSALKKLVLTVTGTKTLEQTTKNSVIRPDQTSKYGFYTSEVNNLITDESPDNGDSIGVNLLKIKLYSMSLSWLFPPEVQPLSCEVGKFDNDCIRLEGAPVDVGYNDSPVFGEDLGGAALPILPYANGLSGTIAFHASAATVPRGRTPYYLRATLLQQNDRGSDSINYAMMAMFLAQYPLGFHTVTALTRTAAGGDPDDQLFMPFSACNYISGPITLDFVLPVSGAPLPATTQVTANLYVIVQPTFGPTASGAVVPNALMNVNYIGQPAYQAYPLARFMYTWLARPASPIDSPTLMRFAKQICQIVKRTKDWEFATELSCVLGVRYPIMTEADIDIPTIYNNANPVQMEHQNFFAQRPHYVEVNFPTSTSSYDFTQPDLNPMWWNKIMCGAYDAELDGGPAIIEHYMDGSPRFNQYAIIIARNYAITGQAIFRYHGQSTRSWDEAFSQTDIPEICKSMRKYFATSDNKSSNHAIIYSSAGSWCASGQLKLTGSSPAFDMYGLSVWHYMNTPRVGFQAVYSVPGLGAIPLGTPLPCILPDIWLQLMCRKRPLAFTPFIPALQRLTGIYDATKQVLELNAGDVAVPTSQAGQARSIGLNGNPLCDDVELFNSRLLWHTFTSSLYSTDGVPYLASTITPGAIVVQKAVPPDYTTPNLIVANDACAITTWFPTNTFRGRRLVVGVAAAAGANRASQILDGRNFTSIMCWVINKVEVLPNLIVNTISPNSDGIWEDESDQKS